MGEKAKNNTSSFYPVLLHVLSYQILSISQKAGIHHLAAKCGSGIHWWSDQSVMKRNASNVMAEPIKQ